MTIRLAAAQSEIAEQRRSRRGTESLRLRRCRSWWRQAWWLPFLLLLAAGLGVPVPVAAQGQGPAVAPARSLALAEVLLEGATRTPLATVYRYLPLRPGQAIDQTALVAAVDQLRASGLFKSVSFYTRPGAERGQIVLVLEVQEQGFDFRWAAGNTDLDGWFLSPATLARDNPFGRGGLLDLQWRVGFRHSGLLLRYDRPRSDDGRSYWGARLSVRDTDRPYFAEGVEYRHLVGSSGLAGVYGHRVGGRGTVELGLELETVDVSDHATAISGSPDGSIDIDQEIPAALLPIDIQAAVGRVSRGVAHVDWQHDTRSAGRRAGSPTGGLWGRVKGQMVLQDRRSHAGLQADLRAFQEVPGGVLATRLRAAWVGEPAAFYDRLYLGGMYSVRGFATHALSAPGGDTWLWSGSVEYRSCILADARGTKLAGLFFLDAGAAGSSDQPDPYPGVAAGVGYGVRLRVWWLDWVGLDVGFPLTGRPLDQRFQATASIGWSF